MPTSFRPLAGINLNSKSKLKYAVYFGYYNTKSLIRIHHVRKNDPLNLYITAKNVGANAEKTSKNKLLKQAFRTDVSSGEDHRRLMMYSLQRS